MFPHFRNLGLFIERMHCKLQSLFSLIGSELEKNDFRSLHVFTHTRTHTHTVTENLFKWLVNYSRFAFELIGYGITLRTTVDMERTFNLHAVRANSM